MHQSKLVNSHFLSAPTYLIVLSVIIAEIMAFRSFPALSHRICDTEIAKLTDKLHSTWSVNRMVCIFYSLFHSGLSKQVFD